MLHAQFGEPGWPRDFEESMFLGSLAVYLNRAFHADAENEDVTLPARYVDRTSKFSGTYPERFEEQQLAFRRGERARTHLVGLLGGGEVGAFWRDDAGNAHLVEKGDWTGGLDNEAVRDLLTRFERPDGLTPPSQVSGSSRYLYIDRAQAEAAVAAINPRTRIESFSTPLLPQQAARKFADRARLSLAATVVWIATRDEEATAGAADYLSRSSLATAAGTAAFARDQIRDHYCGCARPVCSCWSQAENALKLAGQRGEIGARGFANGVGDASPVPPDAWCGEIAFAREGELRPEKEGGTRWSDVKFALNDVLSAFPRREARASPTPERTSGPVTAAQVNGAVLACVKERKGADATYQALKDRFPTVSRASFRDRHSRLWLEEFGDVPTVGANSRG